MTKKAAPISSLTIELEDGEAHCMGDGMFIVLQRDQGVMQNVAVSQGDLTGLLDHPDLTAPLEEGTAEYAGSDMWVLYQRDDTSGTMQNVAVSRQDVERMLEAA